MSTQLAMILIDKESRILSAIKKQRQNGIKEDTLNFPKIFLLATHLSPSERNELKWAGIIDDILMKPLWLSVLINYYRKKLSELGNLLIDKRILVVDDNAVNRKVAEGVLQKYGAGNPILLSTFLFPHTHPWRFQKPPDRRCHAPSIGVLR
jgi:histidine kinase 2/3/4 (cytokinin receptor)